MSKSYTVQVGDTFDIVSRKNYGTQADAGRIMRANPGVTEPLTPGTNLVIPPTTIFGHIPTPKQVSPANNPDELAITIGGVLFRFWTSVTVVLSMDSFSSFSMTAPFDPNNQQQRDLFKPFSFKTVTITLGGSPLFTGTMVNVSPEVSPDQKTITIDGYSLPGVLNDCTAPASMYPVEYSGFGLWEISKVLIEPFGLDQILDGNDAGPEFEKAAIMPTEKVLAFLTKLAAQRNFIMTSTPDGLLRYWRSVSPGNPVARFFDGSTIPIVAAEPSFNPQDYFSHVTSLSPSGAGQQGSSYTVSNPHLTDVVRPLVRQAADTNEGDIKTAAESFAARRFANTVSYSLGLSTWRDSSGNLWSPNTTVTLFDPNMMIYDDYEFMIRTVELTRTRDSETSQIELILPGVFNGQIPERMPWDS